MSTIKGQYSKGVEGGFDENERLLFGLVRPGIPWVDADENKTRFAEYTWVRRALESLIGNASPNSGYQCVGDGATNDIQITGGDGTLNGAGRMFIAGLHCFLKSDVRFTNSGTDEDELSLFPESSFITGLGNVVLEDSSADYVVDSLIGRTITPDVTQPGITATVVSNTARTITTDTDLITAGVLAGARYRVEMRTPSGSGRNDGVYLNVHLDEVDGDELASIKHNLGTSMAAQFFVQVRCSLEVHEGDTPTLPGDLSDNYVDADGLEHFRIKIADIDRADGVGVIAAPDVSDLRATAGNFTNFLNKTGDNMTGDLSMLAGADILLAAGGLVDGRDPSVDGTKLDTITWTPQGIADQLPLISWPVTGMDVVGVTSQTFPVGFSLRDRTPGGTDVLKGVFTTAPENNVIVQNADTNDDFTAGTDNLQKVFGRLTENHPFPNLTGTWTFTNATFTVAGSGGGATTELNPGDSVIGPDGLYYTVSIVVDNDNFTTVEPFAGTTGAIASPAARRWILALVMNDQGTESNATPGSSPNFPNPCNVRWHFEEVFDSADRPVRSPFFSVPSDQVAAEVPDATETSKGKAQYAPDENTDALKAVQGNDARLLGAQGANNAVALVPGDRGPVRLIEGTNVTVAYAYASGEHQFTITSTQAVVPGFSILPADLLPDTGVAGSVGSSGTLVHSDHVHPRSTDYTNRDGLELKVDFPSAQTGTFASAVLAFRPRVLIGVSRDPGGDGALGMAFGTGALEQAYNVIQGGSGLNTGLVGVSSNPTSQTYRLDGTFARGNSLTFTRTNGAQATDWVYVVLGDNADL